MHLSWVTEPRPTSPRVWRFTPVASRVFCITYPWRCLWRRLSQITMTRPLRRMTLHLSQIFFTLGLTFTT